MKRKMNMFVVAVVVLMMVTGCGAKNGPEKVVAEFIDGMKNFDVETITSKVNSQNPGKSLDIEDSLEETLRQYVKANAKKIKYHIRESKIDGDRAVVRVDFNYVNGQPIFAATLSEYMEQASESLNPESREQEKSEDEVLEEIMKRHIKTIPESFVQKWLEIETINIDGTWYIDDVKNNVLTIMRSNIM